MTKLKSNQVMFRSIIRVAAFPEMDSERIIKDLENNARLWTACSIEKKGIWKDNGSSISLSLSDFMGARGKEDTLGICCSNVDNNKLFEIAKEWGADKVEWKKKRTDSKNELASFEVWWDRNPL